MTAFKIQTRTFPGFPIRERANATRHPSDRLEIVVNQYIPNNNLFPSDGDLTIICAHANGFNKEMYEPFLEYLLEGYNKQGYKIRSIWTPEMSNSGESGILNETKLGGSPAYFDHTRDLLSMIQHFPEHFVQPIAAMGHSIGGPCVVNLAVNHPTLFTCVVAIDPIIYPWLPGPPGNPNPATFSIRRRDVWPDRAAAADYFHKHPFYKNMHPRVLDRFLKHGLRNLPTALHPDKKEGVTLSTTKHQEIFLFQPVSHDRWGGRVAFRLLPLLRVPILYVQGGKSHINGPGQNEEKMAQTPEPKEMIVMKTGTHLMPLEQPEETAQMIAPYLSKMTKRWLERREAEKKQNPVTMTATREWIESFPVRDDEEMSYYTDEEKKMFYKVFGEGKEPKSKL